MMNTDRQIPRRVLKTVIGVAAMTAAVAATAGSSAHANYPPVPPPEDRSLAVEFLDPDCEQDAPYVTYGLRPIGFASTGPTLLTVRDLDGNVVDTFESPGLSGTFLYPGASVGPDGKATDWPGWVRVDDEWVEDPSDARLRDGLSITFRVSRTTTETVTVTSTVTYPGSASACAGPGGTRSSFASGAVAQAPLPATGNANVSTTLLAGGVALLLGIALTSWNVVSNRRRPATDASSG
jgi:hypothetical protein